MRACIRDCFERIIALNKTLSSKNKLTLQGRGNYWGIYYKDEKDNWIMNGLSATEVSLYLDGIKWGLKNQ